MVVGTWHPSLVRASTAIFIQLLIPETASNYHKLTDSEGISAQRGAKRRYFKPKRELLKKQLGHLIITECLSNRQIAERCGTSINNVERWVAEFYAERNQELQDAVSTEHVLTAMNRARDRLERHRKRMIADLESDIYKDAPLSDKAALWGLVCELELIDIKIVESAPEILARRQGLPNGYSLPALMATEPAEPIETIEEAENNKRKLEETEKKLRRN